MAKTDHLNLVKDSFSRAAYQHVDGAVDRDWHVMWSFHSPFHRRAGQPDLPAALTSLSPRQRVNHIPGAAYFTSKSELARSSGALPFVPKSFVLPDQTEQWQAFHAQQAAKGREVAWVQKSNQHRGVELIDMAAPPPEGPDVVVQQLVRPFLIDGRLWDVGFYVAVTSGSPLRAYIFDDALMRHCTMNYTRDIQGADTRTYVVSDDYHPPWSLPSLRPYYTWGMTTLNVMRAHLASVGVDSTALFRRAQATAVQLLHHFQPHMRDMQGGYGAGDGANFFSLYRLDFMLDGDLNLWLIEVNQSPNLSSAHTPDLRNMFQRVSYSLLSLNGLMPGQINHPDTDAEHLDIIAHHSDLDIGHSVCALCKDSCAADGRCRVCRKCREPSQSQHLRRMISEHRHREGFMRIHPAPRGLQDAHPELGSLPPRTATDVLQQTWIELKCSDDASWC